MTRNRRVAFFLSVFIVVVFLPSLTFGAPQNKWVRVFSESFQAQKKKDHDKKDDKKDKDGNGKKGASKKGIKKGDHKNKKNGGDDDHGNHKNKFTRTFTAPTTLGKWYITLVRQIPPGKKEAELKAKITLNGQRIITHRDLSPLFRKQITLLSSNIIIIELKGDDNGTLGVFLDGYVPASSIPGAMGKIAAEITFFGPGTYTRTSGKKNTFTENITLPTTDGLFWMEVTNPATGATRISSAEIKWNGLEVYEEDDFKGGNGDDKDDDDDHKTAPPVVQIKPVLVNATNQMVIELKSRPGSALSIRVIGIVIDDGTPTLTIKNPAGGFNYGTSPPALVEYGDAITGINRSTFKATLNNTTDVTNLFSVGDSIASATIGSGLVQGSNTLEYSIQDRAGNETRSSVSFTYDTVKPTLTLNPANNALVTTTTPTLSVSYFDPTPRSGLNLSTLVIRLDGADITSNFTKTPTGASYAVPGNSWLSRGQHIFYVQLSDNAGNSESSTSTFTVKDIDPPTLTIQQPTSGTIYQTPPSVSVTYSDAFSGMNTTSFSATLNGSSIVGAFNVTDSIASGNLSTVQNLLVQGQNNLTLEISDFSGNKTAKSVSFTYDTTPPAFSSTTPLNGSFIKTNTPLIEINYSDSPSGIDTAGV